MAATTNPITGARNKLILSGFPKAQAIVGGGQRHIGLNDVSPTRQILATLITSVRNKSVPQIRMPEQGEIVVLATKKTEHELARHYMRRRQGANRT